jgi:hypothetical protein
MLFYEPPPSLRLILLTQNKLADSLGLVDNVLLKAGDKE